MNASSRIRGETALEVAVKGGNTVAIQLLLKRPDDDTADEDKNGNTMLHFAAAHGYIKVIDILLEKKSQLSIDARDIEGETTLHVVLAEGRHEVARLLIHCPGIELNVMNRAGQMPLYTAANLKDCKSICLLLQIPGIQTTKTDDEQHYVLAPSCSG